jgi:predicted O-methyltransferase YrrM
MHLIPLDSPTLTAPEPVFSSNWTRGRAYWGEMFDALGLNGKPELRFLEIGCFEGRASLWMLENVLTDPTSRLDVIDTFEGSPEFEVMGIDGATLNRFTRNVAPYADQVTVMQGMSGTVLRTLPAVETYDFIYVDGSHAAPDVLTDAVLAWPLLKQRGVMVFDDYLWVLRGSEHERPGIGIDAFRSAFGAQMALIYQEFQLAVAKL